jgi:alpha-galactosidase
MDSDLYRAHLDWALTDEFTPVLGRHQLLLDLTKPEVRDYIVENISRILDTAGVSYVKWDMNRHSIALGTKAHDFILGLYDVLRRIFEPRPQVLLESCSSGGNRFDLGMLCYSPQVWCSDDTDPIERLTIQGSLSYLYPQSTFGAHVSAAPHAQTLRTTPLTTRGNVSFFGCLGYELDLKHLLGVEEKEVIAQTAFYKEHRMAFQFGDFRRVESREGVCWQVNMENVTVSGLFHKLESAAPAYEKLRIVGLDAKKRYHVLSRAQKLRIGVFGNLVKHIAPMDVDPNGVLLRTVDHHIMLDDGTEDITASGAALQAGVMLHNRFAGTGYTKEQRTQGDFGSNVYVVTDAE